MEMVQKEKMTFVYADDAKDLAQAALERFIQAAGRAIAERGVFYVAISGGSTPGLFYELLSGPSACSQIDWAKVHLFWVDERCVQPSAAASNFGLAANTFLLNIPIPGQNVHRVTGEEIDYAKAAKEYEQTILNVFGLPAGSMPVFDLVLLGMGADGHIGSLLPNTYALFDTDDLVSAVYRMDGDFSRITLTVPVLKAARHLFILISGAGKADIVGEVFCCEPDPVRYPVHALWSILNKITWFIDRPAAALIR